MIGYAEPNALRPVIAASAAAAAADGIDKVLQAVRTHLGMDVAFVSEFHTRDRLFRNVNARGRTPIHAGDTAPLDSGYCQRVVDGRLPQLIPDARAVPAAAALPETSAIPIGAHLSVPIRLSDGRIYGTFCCFSYLPDSSLTERDLQMMKAFADLVANQIDDDMRAASERETRVSRITEALERNEPAIVYQPIYDLETQRIAGVEALSRFQSVPALTPDVWFREAAAVGLGPQLEAAAARKALAGIPLLPADTYVAINASPDFILCGSLAAQLHDANLDRVMLEITEHASVVDYDELVAELAPLRALGLRVAIDDAGAGYSSMRHILSIEPDVVKLDMSLVRGIDRDLKRRALASALIAFARETKIGIVAEGVETAAELATLRALGVKRVQGYLLGRPVQLQQLRFELSLPEVRTLDEGRKGRAAL